MHEGKKHKDYSLGLHGAAMNGNVGLVKFALDHGASINSVVNGYMPLQLACINDNNIAVVQYLIDRGADINAQRWSKKHSTDKSQAVAGAIGSTALHVACVNGCTRSVDILLRNGAKMDVRDKYGSRPIDLAAAKHHVEIVKLLRTYGSSEYKGLLQQESSKMRRSVDMSYSTSESSKEHFRRPSLPCILESRKNSQTDIPPVPSLPPSRNSPQHPRHFTNDVYFSPSSSSSFSSSSDTPIKTPELGSWKSSEESSELFGTPPMYSYESYPESRHDYYSYGVIDHFEGENYLNSLERRAFGLSYIHDDTPKPLVDTTNKNNSNNNSSYRPSLESASLKRCSSDGGYLRTTALMNAMSASTMSPFEGDTEPLPRPSIYEDRPNVDVLKQEKELKKTWWSSIMGGNAYKPHMDHPLRRSSTDSNSRRSSSIEFRPSIESLSQLAKRSVEGLSCKNTDFSSDNYCYSRENELKKTHGFISRWVGNWSNTAAATTTTATATARK